MKSWREYDFDEVIDRRGTNSAKWDTLAQVYGKTDLIHLGVADMDFKSSPEIIQAIQTVAHRGVFGYTDLNEAFYVSIIHWYKDQKKVIIKKDWIIFCPRINIGASVCVNSLTEKEDEIIVNQPVYPPLLEAVKLNGREVIENPLQLENDHYQIDFSLLEKKITSRTKLLILTNPDNPTGRVWCKEELDDLHDFCDRHNLLIFSDDIHSSIIKQGVTFTSILDTKPAWQEQVICADSITKAFNVPGCLISYLIIPNQEVREKIQHEIARIGMNNPNIFSLPILEAAYNESNQWLMQVNQYIDKNETLVRQFFSEYLPDFVINQREGTYLLWISYKDLGISEAQLMTWFIQEVGVEVYPGSHFGGEGSGFFRINIATSKVTLIEALNRMKTHYSALVNSLLN